MSFLSWVEFQGEVYMVIDHDVCYGSKKNVAEHVDPLGHDVIRAVHNLPPYYEGGLERWEPRFWELSMYPAVIQPFLKDPETILRTWGKSVGYCMKEEDVAFVMGEGPDWAKRIVLDMLYDAVSMQQDVDRARFILRFGKTWHFMPEKRMILTDFIQNGDYNPGRAQGKRASRITSE
jgi:hypothetical protein